MNTAAALTLPDLKEGAKSSVRFSVDDAQMHAFAELSGDYNPLHCDDVFARAKGYQGRVVYGALLLAKVSRLIGMQLPGLNAVWASVSFDFRKPLYVGEEAELEGTVVEIHAASGLLQLALAMRRAERLLGRGKAEVLLG